MDSDFIALNVIDSLEKKHFNQVKSILTEIKPIADDFINKEDIEPPYNIILATSDIYRRENYHSDIMVYILKNKPNTLKYFIEYINGLSDMPKINENDYLEDTEVIREESKIDILIRSQTSRHCIIVENKINNAGDMPMQLPRYYSSCSDAGYTVDRILYYSLDGKKEPDRGTWKPEEEWLKLDDLIVRGAAADGSETDYKNAFLIKCKNNTENEQEKAFYCQYIDLLEYLRRYQLDYQLMEKFYNVMLDAEQCRSALSIRDMLNDLVRFRRDRIYDCFLNNRLPFRRIGKWQEGCCFFETIQDLDIVVDIFTNHEHHTEINFFRRNKSTELIKNILEKIGEDSKFTINGEGTRYVRTFKFPEEEDLMYEYVKKFISLLKDNIDTIVSSDSL